MAFLVQNLEEPVVDTSEKQMEQWSILSNELKHMQYSQYPLCMEVKVLEEMYETKKYKRLQFA